MRMRGRDGEFRQEILGPSVTDNEGVNHVLSFAREGRTKGEGDEARARKRRRHTHVVQDRDVTSSDLFTRRNIAIHYGSNSFEYKIPKSKFSDTERYACFVPTG